MGIEASTFRNLLRVHRFALNHFRIADLRQAGCLRSFPIDSRCGGAPPGQNRDKSQMGTRAAEVCAAGQPMPANAPWVGGLIQGRERISRTSARRRGGRRSKAEIDDDRRERLARTIKEIDELYAEYELQLPADFRIQRIGTAYARFSTRFQDSVSDQIRTLLDHALSIGVFVPRDLIFFDLAVRGFKKHRSGLDGVRRTLKSRRASVLLLFSTSRLFRKRYRTLEFVDQMHKGLGVR